MKFRAVPQIPRSADPAVQAVLEALKENFELMTGQRGSGDFVIDQLGYVPESVLDRSVFSARAGTVTPAPSVTVTPVALTVEISDEAGCFDPSSGRFYPARAGFYHFDFGCRLENLAVVWAHLLVSGQSVCGGSVTSGLTYVSVGSHNVHLVPGEYVQLGAYHGGGGTYNVSTGAETRLSGFLITPD